MFSSDVNWWPLYHPLKSAGWRLIAVDARGHGRGLRAEARFRIDAPNAKPKRIKIIALDRPSEAVVKRLAQKSTTGICRMMAPLATAANGFKIGFKIITGRF